MADLLLLSLVDDEALARPLAAVFQRAGLTVAGGQGRADEIARVGAVVVLWSPNSAPRAAFKAIGATAAASGKAVFACTHPAPTPAGSRRHDLNGWRGDPDDRLLDGLFGDVDRLLLKARTVQAPARTTARAPEPALVTGYGAPLSGAPAPPPSPVRPSLRPAAPSPAPGLTPSVSLAAPAPPVRPEPPVLRAPSPERQGQRGVPVEESEPAPQRLRHGRSGVPLAAVLAVGVVGAVAGALVAWRDVPIGSAQAAPEVAHLTAARSPDPAYGPPGEVKPAPEMRRIVLSESAATPRRAASRTSSAAKPAAAPRVDAESAALPPEADDRAAYRGEVVWRMRPGPGLLETLRPSRARAGTSGWAALDCTVLSSMEARCRLAGERPAGQGFGAAALEAAQVLVAEPKTSTGQSAVGVRARVEVEFPPTA